MMSKQISNPKEPISLYKPGPYWTGLAAIFQHAPQVGVHLGVVQNINRLIIFYFCPPRGDYVTPTLLASITLLLKYAADRGKHHAVRKKF